VIGHLIFWGCIPDFSITWFSVDFRLIILGENIKETKMYKIIVLVLALVFIGCAVGEKVTRLNPGMSQDQVIQIMGKPDGFKQ